MSSSQSPHLAQIPQAVRIAASPAQAVDPALKTQAIEYLGKVRELCEETWQVGLIRHRRVQGSSSPVRTAWRCMFRELAPQGRPTPAKMASRSSRQICGYSASRSWTSLSTRGKQLIWMYGHGLTTQISGYLGGAAAGDVPDISQLC